MYSTRPRKCQSAPTIRGGFRHLAGTTAHNLELGIIRKLRGEEAERQRLGAELPAGPVTAAEEKAGPPLLLAQAWDNSTDLTDWWMSEKLDGVRAFWDGKQFVSRQGNRFHAPGWFLAGLPTVALDGELWIGRKPFQRTVSIVRRQDESDLWQEVRFLVFDAPHCAGGFEARLRFLAEALRTKQQPYVDDGRRERRGTAVIGRACQRSDGDPAAEFRPHVPQDQTPAGGRRIEPDGRIGAPRTLRAARRKLAPELPMSQDLPLRRQDANARL
jgi:hypothetical protein